MKIIKSLVLFILFTTSTVFAQSSNSLLWEVSGKGLSKPSYLFGTYHFAGKSFLDSLTIASQKLQSAEAVVGELIIDPALATKLVPHMMLTNNSLDKILSPADYELVASVFNKYSGMDLKLFNALKPAAVQMMMMQYLAPKSATETNPALDQYVQDYGKSKNLPVIGLEEMEDQVTVLFGATLERQAEVLVKIAKDPQKNIAEANKLYTHFKDQNLKELEKLILENPDTTQEELDKMLKHRNEKWMLKLPEIMAKQSAFIAVGAAHLITKDGLVELLKKAGYTVKPIKSL
ncbi:MAG: TraB/GumN family protein [Pedobacter sp.]|nr:MAG: TraB/GumN family protein [Pedobacter sp.]